MSLWPYLSFPNNLLITASAPFTVGRSVGPSCTGYHRQCKGVFYWVRNCFFQVVAYSFSFPPAIHERVICSVYLHQQLFLILAILSGHNHFPGLFSLDIEFIVFSFCLSDLWKNIYIQFSSSFIYFYWSRCQLSCSLDIVSNFSSECLQDFLSWSFSTFWHT